jgi:hypothetical protein
MRVLGYILLAAGIIMLLIKGISYTTKEKVVDAGPIEISKKENHTLTWPYYAGGIMAVAGLILVLSDRRRS